MLKKLTHTRCTLLIKLLIILALAVLPAALRSTVVVRAALSQTDKKKETFTTITANRSQQRPRRVSSATTAAPAPPATTTTATPPAPPAPLAGGKTTSSSAATTTPVGEEVDEDDVVRVETELVSVPVVVTNQAGRSLGALRTENFSVFEDNRPQRITNFSTTDAPFEVALLLDTSGSTSSEVALIRRAANAFIDALRTGDRVAVLAFNMRREGTSQLAVVEVKTRLTDDRVALRKAVEEIGASSGTPFYDGLLSVTKDVFNEPSPGEVRGRQALVALTDGVDSTSDADYAEAREALFRRGVTCYFIQINTEDFVEERLMRDCNDDGTLRLSSAQLQRYRRVFAPRTEAADYSNFCGLGQFERMQISRNLYGLARHEMNELAKGTGGKTFAAEELRDARRAFAQVAAEIGTQYSLGYYSTNKARDGRFRNIRIEVKGVTDAQVRARPGYYAKS